MQFWWILERWGGAGKWMVYGGRGDEVRDDGFAGQMSGKDEGGPGVQLGGAGVGRENE